MALLLPSFRSRLYRVHRILCWSFWSIVANTTGGRTWGCPRSRRARLEGGSLPIRSGRYDKCRGWVISLRRRHRRRYSLFRRTDYNPYTYPSTKNYTIATEKTLSKATEKYGQEGIYVGRIEHFLKNNRVKNFCIMACRKWKKAVIFIVHDQRDTVSVLQFISIMTFFNQLKTVQLSWKMFIGKLFSSIKFWFLITLIF